jgi:hypothetical protein
MDHEVPLTLYALEQSFRRLRVALVTLFNDILISSISAPRPEWCQNAEYSLLPRSFLSGPRPLQRKGIVLALRKNIIPCPVSPESGRAG